MPGCPEMARPWKMGRDAMRSDKPGCIDNWPRMLVQDLFRSTRLSVIVTCNFLGRSYGQVDPIVRGKWK